MKRWHWVLWLLLVVGCTASPDPFTSPLPAPGSEAAFQRDVTQAISRAFERGVLQFLLFVAVAALGVGGLRLLHREPEPPLIPGEHVILQVHIHWIIFVWAGLRMAGVILVNFLLALLSPWCAAPLYLFFVVALLHWMALYLNTYLCITERRAIVQRGGLFRRNTVELFLNQVEGITVRRSLFGRLLRYGTLFVAGSGNTQVGLPYIREPEAIRQQINVHISAALGGPPVAAPAVSPAPMPVVTPAPMPVSVPATPRMDFTAYAWKLFALQGYQVTLREPTVLAISGNNRPPALVLCVDAPQVNAAAIAPLLGMLLQVGIARGYVVTSGAFALEAMKAAQSPPPGYSLTLIDGSELTRKAQQLGV